MDTASGLDEGIPDLPLLDLKILCKTATMPEICPLSPPYICEEVQFTQILRSSVSRATKSTDIDF